MIDNSNYTYPKDKSFFSDDLKLGGSRGTGSLEHGYRYIGISKDKQLSDALKPKQCPNCNEPNNPDSKFCAKCRIVLTYDAYNETIKYRLTSSTERRQTRQEGQRQQRPSSSKCKCHNSEPGKINLDVSVHEPDCWIRKRLLSRRYTIDTSVTPDDFKDGYSLGAALTS